MPTERIRIADAVTAATILGGAIGGANVLLERQLREKAGKGGYGRIGQIRLLSHDWYADPHLRRDFDAIDAEVQRVRRMRDIPIFPVAGRTRLNSRSSNCGHWPPRVTRSPARRGIQTPTGVFCTAFGSPQRFIEDLIRQPVFDDDDVDIEVRLFLFWNVVDGVFTAKAAPIRLNDVSISTGISLSGVAVNFVQIFASFIGAEQYPLEGESLLATFGTALQRLVDRELMTAAEKLGGPNPRLEKVWIDNLPIEFWAQIGW